MPLRFSRGGCKGRNPAPHNAIVENTPGFPHRVEKTVDFSPLFHSLWKTMLKSTVCKAVCNPRRPRIRALQQKNTPPRSPVDMHKNPDGQIPQANRKPPPDVHKCRWTEPPAFPQKTEKIRPQRPVCRGRNAAGHPKIPPKPPPDADFHNPSRQNPDIPHRTAPAKTPKSSCRGWIFRFSTVPRPLLLLLLDGKIEGWTDRARARGRRKAGRR